MPELWVGLAVGSPIALLTWLLGSVMFFGGKKLGKLGDATANQAQIKAIRGLARQRDGVVRAKDVARQLHIDEPKADAILTELAKQPDEDVGIDISDEGEVLYLFDNPAARRWRVRVDASDLDPEEAAALAEPVEIAAEAASPPRQRER